MQEHGMGFLSVIARNGVTKQSHREGFFLEDCFASLAMTKSVLAMAKRAFAMTKGVLAIMASVFCLFWASSLWASVSAIESSSGEYTLQVRPLFLNLSFSNEGGNSVQTIELESLDPNGNPYPVLDEAGNGQWVVEGLLDQRVLKIQPSLNSYAGPVQVQINGKVVDRFNQMIPSSQGLLIEKILSHRMSDGITLQVHYTDFLTEKYGDPTYPNRVMQFLKYAYEILTEELELPFPAHARVEAIDVYLGDSVNPGLYPFGGFQYTEFKRAPLFLIRQDPQTRRKNPVILLPGDYREFVKFWEEINPTPRASAYSQDAYLMGSVMHELTHAIIHSYNENLGSTEHQIRSGDWYTEGLARYFETKVKSDAGFASQGFRKLVGDKIQFSRGGANYFLRYPDESFFDLRYENALFWMYVEKVYGPKAIVRITEALDHLPFDTLPSSYADAVSKVLGPSFVQILDAYLNWVFQRTYLNYSEGKNLLSLATTRAVWSSGKFFTFTKSGALLEKSSRLDHDWVSYWGNVAARGFDDRIAGDMTHSADIGPLTADTIEIIIGKNSHAPKELRFLHLGDSKRALATIYWKDTRGQMVIEKKWINLGKVTSLHVPADSPLQSVQIVLSNLDFYNSLKYAIEIV